MNPTAQIYEVCLRDGLQNEPVRVPTSTKLRVAKGLIAAGFRDIEITSFVSPRWVPQLADASELFASLPKGTGARFWALVPNRVGLDRAVDAGVRHIATFVSASEAHNLKNVNRTVAETMSGLSTVIDSAIHDGLGVRSYVSCSFGCPFEGAVAVERVVRVAQQLRDAGASVIALGDTTGMAHPDQVVRVLDAMAAARFEPASIALHFHDTRGLAMANALAGWRWGVRRFDASVGGVGGCPYAPGAAGNVATEDMVHAFERLGGERQEPPAGRGPVTGVDLDAVHTVANELADALGRSLTGRHHLYVKGQVRRKAESA